MAKDLLYLGYKSHASIDAETGLITTIVPTGGSASAARQFSRLLAHDQAVDVTADICVGDKAYDDTDAHFRLWEEGKRSALRLNDRRTAAGNPQRDNWLKGQDSGLYQVSLPQRYKIERNCGEAKRSQRHLRWHG